MKKYLETLSSKKIIKDQSLLRHEDIKNKIHILPELKAFIPPLLPDELAQLESNIRRDGCREALLVWETTEGTLTNTDDTRPVYVLVDGHNRYAICQKWTIDFRVNLVEFETLEEVRSFMLDNQLGRRNLTPEQTAYLRGLRYLSERNERGKYDRSEHKGQNVPYDSVVLPEASSMASADPKSNAGSTSQRLAKQFSVNEKTIKRDAEFATGIEKLSPDLKTEVLSGKSPINKTLIQQLARLTVPNGSLSSVAAVAALSAPVAEPTTSTKKKPKAAKPHVIHKKLKTLVDQLATPSANITLLCDEIISQAAQLKAVHLQ